jgi:hypothetical protein
MEQAALAELARQEDALQDAQMIWAAVLPGAFATLLIIGLIAALPEAMDAWTEVMEQAALAEKLATVGHAKNLMQFLLIKN